MMGTLIIGTNDLESQNKSLSEEWNYERNGTLTPRTIAVNSNKKVWWRCSICGQEWQSTVCNRNKGNGCPVCANKTIVPGINDLATLAPELIAEWDYSKNEFSPSSISTGSNKKAWWKCNHCGFEWQATIASRHSGTGCPRCGKKKQLEGVISSKIEKLGSLLQNHPELCQDWDFEKNAPLTPASVLSGSNTKVWWKCHKCGNSWFSTIHSRSSGIGCPICSNKKVIPGYNDLATIAPMLAQEWCLEKNGLSPSAVSEKSGKVVWWKCSICGFEWKTSVAHRRSGTGCPYCNQKNQTSYPEQAIFYYIKMHFSDAENGYTSFFNDKKAYGMEFDIFIPSINTAIEYDGIAWHNSEVAFQREKKKYSYCKKYGIVLIRVKEQGEKTTNDSEIAADYCFYCSNHPNNDELSSVVLQIGEVLGIKIIADCGKDEISIKENYYNFVKANSVAKQHPELLDEWDYQKNGLISPEFVPAMSSCSFWWKCSVGHEWKVSPSNRVFFHSKCPFCSNKKTLAGFNDLATTHPELLSEWDYEKNKDVNPTSIQAGNCKKKVWWVCSNKHHWTSTVNNRLKSGCPICSGKKVLVGFNDLATKYPSIASEWNYERNTIRPTDVTTSSNKKVWWKCSQGHEWEATINNRTNGTGCPICSNKRIIPGVNDMATTNPVLLEEWDFEKNSVKPTEIGIGSSKKIWWKCRKCGYNWAVSPACRYRNGRYTSCPACSHNAVFAGVNDFESQYPNEAQWWDKKRNYPLLPSMIGPHSEKIVWWICDKGHSFKRAVKYASRGQECPICYGRHSKGVWRKSQNEEERIPYDSLKQAAIGLGIDSSLRNVISGISKACKTKSIAYGFYWEWRE